MASEDIDELVLKVSVDVNEDELKKLRDNMKKFQDETSKTKLNLVDQAQIDKLKEEIGRIKEAARSILGENGGTNQRTSNQYSGYIPKIAPNKPIDTSSLTTPIESDQSLEILRKIEQNLNEGLILQKKEDQRETRTTDQERRNRDESGVSGVLGMAHGVADQSLATTAGGAVGGVIGSFGGVAGAIAGAQIGSSIAALIEKIGGNVNQKVEQVSQLFDKQLSENIQFRQIHQTTGMAVEQIYKLGVEARLAGTSLQDVVDSNQRLSDEMITGMSDTKAQLLMALNINPRTALLEAGGDPQKLNRMLFQSALSATQGYPAAYRTSVLKGLGYNEKEQDWRRYINRPDYAAKADEAYNAATQGGKNPIHMGEQLQKDIIAFRGNREISAATFRSLLTKDNLAQKLGVESAKIYANSAKIIIGAIDSIEGLGKAALSPNPATPAGANVNQDPGYYMRLHQQLLDKQNSHPNIPASDSGASRSAAAGGG